MPIPTAPQIAGQRIRYRALDTLRGVAALAVALGHFEALRGLSSPYYRALDFFLLLSGFVLAHSYFAESRIGLIEFAWRRFARMYPLHLLTLLLILGLAALFSLPTQPANILKHLLFIQNMGIGPNQLVLNMPSWTISVEFWLNIGTYAFILLLGGLRQRTIVLLSLGAMICFLITIISRGSLDTHIHDYKQILNSGLVRCAGSFALGIVIYVVHRSLPHQRFSTAVEVIVLTLFALSLLAPWSGHTKADALVPLLYCGVILVCAAQSGALTRLLAKGSAIGDISFSIYLLHWPVAVLTRELLPETIRPTLVESCVFAAVVLGLSACCYRWFEIPVYRKLVSFPGFSGRPRQSEPGRKS